ncbi:MAG TPA: thiol reductant ABC exporter subunit CydD [Candidatus Marinimicrobia bacterium]|nr:thiol reductant ABC exporter subunit CydD [Candidatus Neomarinimicrobiota bacterium]
MNLNPKLIKYVREAPFHFVGTLLYSVGVGISAIAQACILSLIISGAFLDNRSRSELIALFIWLIGITLLRITFSWLKEHSAYTLAYFVKASLRKKLLHHIGTLGPAFLKGERTGELSATLTEGIETLDAWFSEYLPQLFLSAIIPILFLIVVFPADWLSGLVLLLTAPIIPVLMLLIGEAAKSLTQKQFLALSRLGAHYLDILQGLLTLKLFGKSKSQAQEIAYVSNLFRHKTMGVLKVAFLSAFALEMTATIATAVLAVQIGVRLLYAKIAFEPALFILILAPEFYMPLRLLGSRFHAGQEGLAAALRIFAIFDQKATQYIPNEKSNRSVACLTFQNVRFQFADSQTPALSGLSIQLEENKIHAIAGPSGAGKSTLIQLLLQNLQPQEGNIFYLGKSIYEMSRDAWQREIAYVSQHPYLFTGTIAENLALGNSKNADTKLWEALRFVELEKLVQSLPKMLDSPTGERGQKLSGGQIQRLALARALLKKARLLILDEVTSHLDLQSEAVIHRCLLKLRSKQTVLVVAHRMKTLEIADNIIFIQNGQIGVSGPHHELLRSDNAYSQWLKEIL